MCDNLGIADNVKDIKVWKLTTEDYSNIVFTDAKAITEWVLADIESGNRGDEYEYTITIDLMSQQELDALPEVD